MEYLYRSIPDSDLKAAADELVEHMWDPSIPISEDKFEKYQRLIYENAGVDFSFFEDE